MFIYSVFVQRLLALLVAVSCGKVIFLLVYCFITITVLVSLSVSVCTVNVGFSVFFC